MLLIITLLHVFILISLRPPSSAAALLARQSSDLFRAYIGAEFYGVKFSDVPINPGVEFHFILSFAIDKTANGSSSTDGHFNVFWDTDNLSPAQVAAIKHSKKNVRVALSLGGDFKPYSIDSWVRNAVKSLTQIIQEYNLDGIDIDYEQFSADPDTFAECIGRLMTTLKNQGVISFASIAPFDDDQVQMHYHALWNKYGNIIDYVNFQFYAYDSSTTVSQFLSYFEKQSSNYPGGKLLASFSTDSSSGGLSPAKGFFSACRTLKKQGKLPGIFVWSADDSMKYGFRYERTSQLLLASSPS
ncbi:hypothetical protein KSP40_PGU002907 [Platanthera guangdongensis]|uniref:GH18 domain-containing protein n=1 Tax=Platanthera guangdongensis TaxID=2320717 RepID=A0ABR2MEQ0_9ASPA